MTTLTIFDSDTSGSASAYDGVLITVNNNCTITTVTVQTNCTASTVYIYLKGGGLLASASTVAGIAVFSLSITTGNSYYVVAGSGGSSYTRTYYTAGSPDWTPVNGTDINATKSAANLNGTPAEFTDWEPNIWKIDTQVVADCTVNISAANALSTTTQTPTINIQIGASAQSLTATALSPAEAHGSNDTFYKRSSEPGTLGTHIVRRNQFSIVPGGVTLGHDPDDPQL